MSTQLLTEDEAATRTRFSKSALQKWRVLGKGPDYIKLGRKVYYRPTDLEKWINQNVVTHNEN